MITADSSEGSMGLEEVKGARANLNSRGKSRGGKSVDPDPERRGGSSVFSRLSQIFNFGKSSSSLKNVVEPKVEVIRRGTLKEVEFKVTAWESESSEEEDDQERVDDGQDSDDTNRA